MNKYLIIIVNLILSVVFTDNLLASQPLNIVAENENVKISYKSKEKCTNCIESNIKFTLFEKKFKKAKELNFKIVNVEEITNLGIYKNKLLIKGRLSYGGSIVTVVALNDLKIIDTIWGYHMYFSDDNRYMVYVEHYPRHALAFIKSIVNIYDVNASPEENRVAKQYISDERYVGIPIYPEENAKNKDVNFSARDEKEQNGYISQFYFYNQNQSVIFIEHYKENYYLAVVDISKGIRESKILRKELVTEALSDEFEEGGVNKFFRVTDIKLEEFFVLTTLENHSKLKNKTIKIRKSLLDGAEKK